MNTEGTERQESTPTIQPASSVAELTAADLRFRVSLDVDFHTTAELEARHDFIGQERARSALELGLGISSGGFNIFVSGLSGADKLEALHGWVAQQATQALTPGDWVYVHNFAHPDEPRAIALAAGRGCRLKHLMAELVKTLREELPKAFRQEAFDKEKAQRKDKYVTQARALSSELEARAREKGFAIQASPNGNIILIPIVNGRLLESPEEFTRLSEEQQ